MKILKEYDKVLSVIDIFRDKEKLEIRRAKDVRPFKTSIRPTGSDFGVVKPIVAATKEILKQGEDYETVKFNPMGENFLSQTNSEVQRELNVEASKALSIRVAGLFLAISETILDTSKHENLNSKAFEFISGIKGPSSDKQANRIRPYIKSLLKKQTGHRGVNAIARIKQRNSVEIDGKKYFRTTELMMPFMTEMQKDVPFGVNPPNQMAAKIVNGIAERLVERLALIDACETDIAPYFMSFVSFMDVMAKEINELADAFGLDTGENFKAGLLTDPKKWRQMFEKDVPITFTGNEGMSKEIAEKNSQAAKKAVPVEKAAIPVEKAQSTVSSNPTQPTPAPAPTQTSNQTTAPNDGVYSFRKGSNMATLNRNNVQSVQQAAYRFDPSVVLGKDNASAEQTAAPTQTALAPENNQSSKLIIEEAPVPAQSSGGGKLIIEEAPSQMVQMKDANGRPVTTRNGAPFKVTMEEFNSAPPLMQVTDEWNNLQYHPDGSPRMRKAVPANNNGQPQQPGWGNNVDPYAAMDMGMQQAAQNISSQLPPLYNQFGQQTQANVCPSTGNILNAPLYLQDRTAVSTVQQIQQWVQAMMQNQNNNMWNNNNNNNVWGNNNNGGWGQPSNTSSLLPGHSF